MSVKNQSYYAVIPANVRYSKLISDGAKLLYAEITCLCNQEGYCWATNSYFGELYGKSSDTISRLISELAAAGFILTIVDGAAGNSRKIWLSESQPIGKNADTPIGKNADSYRQKRRDPIGKNADIILRVNNKTNKQQQQSENAAAVAAVETDVFSIEVLEPPKQETVEVKKEEEAPPIAPAPPGQSTQPSAPPPFRSYEPFDLAREIESIRGDFKMRENLTIVSKVPQPFFDPYLDAFKAQETATESRHNNSTELRKHFFNFCRARYKAEKSYPAPIVQPGTLPQNLRRF